MTCRDKETFGGNYTLPVRGTTTAPAPLPRTGWSTTYLTGDDGNLQAGVAWPGPRFTDHLDGTVTDSLTGLMWTKDGNASGPAACDPGVATTWQEALDHVAYLDADACLGHGDWRLPNRNEILTSTTYASGDLTSNAWFVDLGTITVDLADEGSTRRVWAVRSSAQEWKPRGAAGAGSAGCAAARMPPHDAFNASRPARTDRRGARRNRESPRRSAWRG